MGMQPIELGSESVLAEPHNRHHRNEMAHPKNPGQQYGLAGNRSARTPSGGARTEFRYRILQYDPDGGPVIFRCRLL
jgi:hypothetical protein